MLMIVRMKPRDAVHEMALGFVQRPLFSASRKQPTGCFIAFRSRRGQTRCFSYPGALVACHPDLPSLAQLQANREGTLFGPRLIIFREGLRIVSGNCSPLES